MKVQFLGLVAALAMRSQVQKKLPRTWPQVQEMSLGKNHHLLSFRKEGVRGQLLSPGRQSECSSETARALE